MFKEKGEDRLFYALNNRELSLDKSGIFRLYQLLAKEFDTIENTVSATLKHKVVFEQLEILSGKQQYIEDEKNKEIPLENPEKKKKKGIFAQFSDQFEILGTNSSHRSPRFCSSNNKVIVTEKTPLIDLKELRNILSEMGKQDIEARVIKKKKNYTLFF